MPVRDIDALQHTADYDALVNELLAEWHSEHSTNQEPVILVEKSRDGKPLHLYVIWSKWNTLDGVVRSEIIMDAAVKKLSPDGTQTITIAMGLTPDEANRLNLKWR